MSKSLNSTLAQGDPARRFAQQIDANNSNVHRIAEGISGKPTVRAATPKVSGVEKRSLTTSTKRHSWRIPASAGLAVCATAGLFALYESRKIDNHDKVEVSAPTILCVQDRNTSRYLAATSTPHATCGVAGQESDYVDVARGNYRAIVPRNMVDSKEANTVVFNSKVIEGRWLVYNHVQPAATKARKPSIAEREMQARVQDDRTLGDSTTCITAAQQKEYVAKAAAFLKLDISTKLRWHNDENGLVKPVEGECTWITYSPGDDTVWVLGKSRWQVEGASLYTNKANKLSAALKDRCLTADQGVARVREVFKELGVEEDRFRVYKNYSPHGQCARVTMETGGLHLVKIWGPKVVSEKPSAGQ